MKTDGAFMGPCPFTTSRAKFISEAVRWGWGVGGQAGRDLRNYMVEKVGVSGGVRKVAFSNCGSH